MCHTSFNWNQRIKLLAFGQTAATSHAFQSFLLFLSVLWGAGLIADIRGTAFGTELQSAVVEGHTQLMMAGLWASGFAQVFAVFFEQILPSLAGPRDTRALHIFYATALGGAVIGRKLLSLCGPLLYIHLHSTALLLGSWYLQSTSGFAFPIPRKRTNMDATETTRGKLRALMCIASLSAPYVVLALLSALPRLLELTPSCAVESEVRIEDTHAQALMLRRCALLTSFQLVCKIICFAVTALGIGLLFFVFVEVQGPGIMRLRSGRLLVAHYLARVATFAAFVWIQSEGSRFEWSIRLGVFVSFLIAVIWSSTTGPSYRLPNFLYGILQALGVTGVFAFAIYEHINFFIEDGLLFLGVPLAILRLSPLLKIGMYKPRATKCALTVVGVVLAIVLLLLDLNEDGSRAKIIPYCLAILTPPLCCIEPSQIGRRLRDATCSMARDTFGMATGATGLHATPQATFDHDDDSDAGSDSS
jgi:hypothetical protein